MHGSRAKYEVQPLITALSENQVAHYAYLCYSIMMLHEIVGYSMPRLIAFHSWPFPIGYMNEWKSAVWAHDSTDLLPLLAFFFFYRRILCLPEGWFALALRPMETIPRSRSGKEIPVSLAQYLFLPDVNRGVRKTTTLVKILSSFFFIEKSR